MQPHYTQPPDWDGQRQRSRACRQSWQIQSRIIAQRQFDHVLRHGWLARLIAALRGRSSALLSLADIQPPPAPALEESLGLRTVPIAQICGSEGRSQDFDCHFAPLGEHIRERWVSLAALRSEGHPLPPVELVQVGQSYFVIDGHHRISIARAFGQDAIDARVTRWPAAAALATAAAATALAQV